MSNPGPATTVTSTGFLTPQSNSGGYVMGQSVADLIGFYGNANPVAQQANSVDLVTQLVALGLIASGTAIANSIVNVTASTLTVTAATHAGKIVTINAAAGCAVTLPAATATGNKYTFQLGTTITSSSTTITTGVTGSSCDCYEGIALLGDASATTVPFAAAAKGSSGSDVLTLNGSTTGGFQGDIIEVIDIAAGVWMTKVLCKTTGAPATPFSHT